MKKAIVIGATSGIGRALAEILVTNGYQVGITGRREARLQTLQQTQPDRYFPRAFDCTQPGMIDHLTALIAEMGGVELLVYNSGYGDLNESLDYPVIEQTNNLNVIAFAEVATWAYKLFAAQGQGHFVTISSVAGLRGAMHAPSYNASKAYQISFMEGMRHKAHLAKLPLCFTDVRPGFVDTAMAKAENKFWEATKEKAAEQIYQLIKRKKGIGYVTRRWRLIAFIMMIVPEWLYNRVVK